MLTEAPLDGKAAALEHERLTSLINSMADGVIATDEQANIVLYNGAALNILDSNRDITGRPLASHMRLIDAEGQLVNVQELITKIRTPLVSRDYRLEYADKSAVNLYLSIAPVRLGYGQNGKRGYVVLLRDITREKSLEEERDEFISVVSHELRTPVTIAEGNIGNARYIFERHGDLTQVESALKAAHDQVTFLAGLINDLSTLARAERGKLTLEISEINAHNLLTALVSEYEPQATTKGLEIKSELDPHLETLYSSELYVREILQNFITNAIKYTEHGSVTVGAKAQHNGVEFFVRDTGIGISKGDQAKVFDKFFRSEDYRTRKNSGTGIGLYITIKLAKIIGAQIRMESELNKGSTFTLAVPNLSRESQQKQ